MPITTEPPAYYIGFDGGGTNCRGRLIDRQFRVLAEVKRGTGNIFSDCEGVIRTIIGLAYEALAIAGIPDSKMGSVKMAAGLAGYEISSSLKLFNDYPEWPFHSYSVAHDSHIACLGAHGGEPGAVIILGTGMCGSLFASQDIKKIGGWGLALSDFGSGAWLGREALALSLKAHDGLIAPTLFTKTVMRKFNDSPEELCIWVKTATAKNFARYAPLLFDFAKKGDPVAGSLQKRTVMETTLMFNALKKHNPPRVGFIGGLSDTVLPMLPESIQKQFAKPKADPLAGALHLATAAINADPMET